MMIVSAIELCQGERLHQASENAIHGSVDQRPQNLERLNNFPWNFQRANAISANFEARCPKTNPTTVSAIEFCLGERPRQALENAIHATCEMKKSKSVSRIDPLT
jgi:hypothetical protein